jgi:diguanylate cyclase (GGDEF)-like protein
MVAALFISFSATIFATLPARMTYGLLTLSMLSYAGIVATGHRFPVALSNIDLIGLGVVLSVVSISIRQEMDTRRQELRRLRRIDAERTIALREANARLAELSATDALTGLCNRRSLNEAIERHAVSIVPSRGSGVLMIDVDHFKRFNDHVGHSGGDRCLQLIAGALRGALRSRDDIAARYGGEEFAVILPDADLSETLSVAERLRQAVIDLAIPHPGLGEGRVVTVSIGAAATPHSESILDAIDFADRRLYSAKEAGRDRVHA